MTSELVFLSAHDLIAGYRRKRFSPSEVIDAVLDRIAALEPVLNAWQLVDEAGARRAARSAALRWAKGRPMGLLDGVPTAIKDVTETRGWPTLNGSLAIDRRGPWREDAIVVERLKAHGAVLIGKTATPEFAWKGVTHSKLKGITRNPWNPDLTTGGSSGGAAAAVASGMAAIATGTDSGGSIRAPASFCNIVGYKPSFGRVPVWPASPMMMIEHCGPLVRTVRDAALAMAVMAGPDPRDGYCLTEPAPDFLRGLERGVKGLRIAYSPDLGFAGTRPVMARIAAEACAVFADLGAKVERVRLDIGDPTDASKVLFNSLATRIARGLGRRAARLTEPGLIDSIRLGRRLDALDLIGAEAARRDLTARMAQFHATYDLLICPTVCVAPFAAGKDYPEGWNRRQADRWMGLTFPFDLTGQPAISVPCGFTRDRRPVGLQIVGPRSADALVLRAARAFESAQPMGMQRPPI
ncbi:MAG: amidase [Alphaproteobacteria bacterium]|nr:amidase [Alphaproteobacteria bacterium]